MAGLTHDRYRARWIVPVDGEPIADGTIEIDAGRIVAVHAKHDPRAEDLGNVAVLPGLINAHTHLEFSDLRGPLVGGAAGAESSTPRSVKVCPEQGTGTLVLRSGCDPNHNSREPVPCSGQTVSPPPPFTEWIREVVAVRRHHPADAIEAIALGCHESLQSGTTTVGEIATADWLSLALPTPAPRLVVFRELIGPLPERINEQLAIARRHLLSPPSQGGAGGGKTETSGASYPPRPPLMKGGSEEGVKGGSEEGDDDVRRGLSPHAPYSVHPELFHRLVELAAEYHAPVAMHLAETREELELLAHGSGPFVRLLEEFGVWRDDAIPRGTRPLDYLRPLAGLERALVVHGNYLAEDEVEFLARHPHLTVVYCPRTHAYFGHDAHPWRELLGRGASVALGTDSRASNPDLSLWRELQFLHQRFPEVDPRLLLELGTRRGARALGLQHVTGTLAPGKAADLIVVRLQDPGTDLYANLFHPDHTVIATMCGGRWISP